MHDHMIDGRQERSVLVTLVLGLGIFLVPFDVTVVVVALPGIAKNLDFSVDGAAWVIDAYSLAFTGALLASAALAAPFSLAALVTLLTMMVALALLPAKSEAN